MLSARPDTFEKQLNHPQLVVLSRYWLVTTPEDGKSIDFQSVFDTTNCRTCTEVVAATTACVRVSYTARSIDILRTSHIEPFLIQYQEISRFLTLAAISPMGCTTCHEERRPCQ